MTLKQHVFISYSRNDKSFANQLTNDLHQANIPYWIDREGISHSDPSFESKIREALKGTFACILIASHASFASDYVQGELDIIRDRNIPLVILWIEGEYFTDTVPSPLTRRNYIDCRTSDKYEEQFQIIKNEILNVFQETVPEIALLQYEELFPSTYVSIRFGDIGRIVFDPNRYKTAFDLLNVIFIKYLDGQYPEHHYSPFTYGIDWLLCSDRITNQSEWEFGEYRVMLVVLPWSWAVNPKINPRILLEDLKKNPLADYIKPSTYWEICPRKDILLFGLVGDDLLSWSRDDVEGLSHSKTGGYLIKILRSQTRPASEEEVIKFPYHYILACGRIADYAILDEKVITFEI